MMIDRVDMSGDSFLLKIGGHRGEGIGWCNIRRQFTTAFVGHFREICFEIYFGGDK
jgi:hypothetical protein